MLRRIGRLFSQVGRANFTPFVSPALGLTAAAHLNFVDRRYYGGGGEFREGAFSTFTGAVFGSGAAAGLTGAGTAAAHDISLNWSLLGISAPFIMAAVFRPTTLGAVVRTVASAEAAADGANNRSTLGISGTDAGRHVTIVGGVNQAVQASAALSINTTYAMAALVQTNLFRNSLNGATAGAEDTAGTLPTYSKLRFLENGQGATPFIGAIRHVLFFRQTGGAEITQVNLNTLSGELVTL